MGAVRSRDGGRGVAPALLGSLAGDAEAQGDVGPGVAGLAESGDGLAGGVLEVAGDIEAITTMARLAGHLEDATRQAITGLRESGYSWADIALRLGITRQGAQQRWGDTPASVTDASSTYPNGGCP